MSSLRVGLVGIGMMGRNHARVLHAIDGVDLVAVADPAGDQHGMAGGAVVVDTVAAADRAGHRRGGRGRAHRAITSTPASSSPLPACTR